MNQPDLRLWIIPLLPLAGAAINGLFGRRFKNSMVATVALFFTGASFAIGGDTGRPFTASHTRAVLSASLAASTRCPSRLSA